MPFQQRSAQLIINLSRLRNNFNVLKNKLKNERILATVKADAYGHGIIPIARTLAQSGCNCFGVASFGEGITLRHAGIRKPIVVFIPPLPNEIKLFRFYNLTPTITDINTLTLINKKLRRPMKMHLNIDTGMGRLGFRPEDYSVLFDTIRTQKKIVIEGLYTHFYHSTNKRSVQQQLNRFNTFLHAWEVQRPLPSLIHAANSVASLYTPASRFTMVRPGIMLYGLSPDNKITDPSMQCISSLRTKIVSVRTIPAGTSLSYLARYTTKRKSIIATVAAGYGDGIPRALTNKGRVLVKKTFAKMVGTICMDQLLIDATAIARVQPGDEVVLWGHQGNKELSVHEHAAHADTITYEILCRIPRQVKRIYV